MLGLALLPEVFAVLSFSAQRSCKNILQSIPRVYRLVEEDYFKLAFFMSPVACPVKACESQHKYYMSLQLFWDGF